MPFASPVLRPLQWLLGAGRALFLPGKGGLLPLLFVSAVGLLAQTPVAQINAGGAAVPPFAADTGYSAGSTFSSAAAINTSGVSNAAPAAVYQTVRWASAFNYTIGGLSAGGSYQVRLHFVELTWTAAGQRKFNVAINGTTVLSAFDVFSQVGQNKALVNQFTATANASGQIVVAFSQGGADNPCVAGIEVLTGSTQTVSGYQVNAGGAAVAPFTADAYYSAGSSFSSAAAINVTGVANAAPAAVYQTVRWNPSFNYTFPNLKANTAFVVRLHFVELTWTAAGQRLFNVAINGSSVLSNFDIYAAAGQNKALVREFNATSNASGQIVVALSQGSADNPSIAGIEIVSPSTAPAAPTGLTASAGNAQVSLSWTASSGATTYSVFRGTSAGGESATALVTGLTGTTYTNTGLTNGTTYYYKVAAVNASGTSAQSNEASATPANVTSNAPVVRINAGGSAVSPFAADAYSDSGSVFSSTAAINVSGVTNAAPVAVYQDVRWNTAFSYTIPGLNAGTSYVVRLHFVELTWTAAAQRQFNVAINGSTVLSNFDVFAAAGQNTAVEREFNATANASGQIVVAFSKGTADNPSVAGIEIWTQPPVPGAPTGLTATAGSGQVALSWTAGSNATSYNVYRGTSAGGESATPIATNVTNTNLTDTTVVNGTTYYYRVASVNSAGSSAQSNEASATPRLTPPATPSSPLANAGFGQITVSWGASSGATSYSLFRGTSPGGEGATAYASGITATSYTDNGVTAGTTYYYKVAAVNAAGSSAQSSEVSASPLSANGQGASMPYTRYEAEDGTYGSGATLKGAPTFDKMNLAAQASDQAYVELSTSGAYVQWKVGQANLSGITLRFTLPDTADGMGQSGSVDCYVNGVKVKTISLSSYYMWQYFGGGGSPSDTPNGGVAAFGFDEVHWKLATPLASGDTVRLQSTGGAVVGVDFIEAEPVPAAIAQPAGSVSVASYGASSGAADNLSAFNAAVAAAVASPSKTLYIPEGTYKLSSMWVIGSTSSPISQLTITGAGIWYTNLQFTNSAVAGGGVSVRLSATGKMDFGHMYLNSNLRSRYYENAIYKAFMDNFGVGSRFHDLWEEHFECGFWVADYAYNPAHVATGLVIENSRIRNNLADGVNFCQGTSNSTVQNCSIRNNGDDGLAVWPNNYNGAPMAVNDTFTHNTIEFIWRAGGIAFYGGSGHKATYNYIKDCFMSSGIHANTTFPGYHFETNTGITVSDSTIVACGTSYDAWSGELGAVDLEASSSPIQNFTFTNVSVIDAQRDGFALGFSGGFSGLQFTNCLVNGSGLDGISSSKYSNAHLGAGIFTYGAGAATFTNFQWSNCAGGKTVNQGGFVLTFK